MELSNVFEQIMHCESKGHPYWIDRELYPCLGYSTYQKFNVILDKARQQIEEEGFNLKRHFNQTVKLASVESGAKRKIKVTMLSGYACEKIVGLADEKKGQVKQARIFFSTHNYDFDGDSVKYILKATDTEDQKIQKRNYWFWKKLNAESSQFYIKKIKELDNVSELHRDDSFLFHKAPFHMMYKLGTIERKDLGRAYEFLIEYEVTEPTVGIYYGCKGLILDGRDEEQIEEFNKEWEILKPVVTFYLNCTFPGKDFTFRFKPTNNSNDHTYWPFWVSLYEDEDIIDVGYRATAIIRKIYEGYLANKHIPFIAENIQSTKKSKKVKTKTAFTAQAFSELEKSTDKELLHQFISNLLRQRVLAQAEVFEQGYYFTEMEDSTKLDIALLFKGFFDIVKERNHKKMSKKTPWEDFCQVFLDGDGLPFSAASLKNQYKDFLSKQEDYPNDPLCKQHINNVDNILHKAKLK